MGIRARAILVSAVVVVVVSSVGLGSAASGSGFVNWPGYLFNASHSSTSPTATAITTANVSTLHAAWTFVPDAATLPGQPAAGFVSSPIVSSGLVYIGAKTGEFYALNESTGAVVWKLFTGFQPKITCPARGVSATVTVASDPITHRSMVYLPAADGYLYAVNAHTGKVVWKTVVNIPSSTTNDYYAWSSPTVVAGRIFVGSASSCDTPLVRGSLQSFDQATGTHLATYDVVPSSAVGGGIWTSAAATATSVWVTTGNADETGTQPGDSNSIVRLDAATLTVQDKWTIPGITNVDFDLGASPTLFTATIRGVATKMVGACDKNGVLYAWKAQHLAAGPTWTKAVGNPDSGGADMCLAAATWDAAGARLFHASNSTTIAGTPYAASLRRLDPATGGSLWELGLTTGPILGTPSLNGSNVIAAVTYNPKKAAVNSLFFIDAANGTLLRTITLDSLTFAQPAFADHYVMVATGTELTAWTP